MEWVLLSVHLVVPLVLLVFVWRGRMYGRLTVRGHLPVFLVPAAFHASDLACTLIGGYAEILWLEGFFTFVHLSILLAVFLRGRTVRLKAARKKAMGTAG